MGDEIGERLARIETKLDMYVGNHGDQENRIRGLERFRWAWAGTAGLVGAGALELLLRATGRVP